MTTIKGVILSELSYGHGLTYLEYVPNVDFLISEPDIKITCNENLIENLSFSLYPDPEDKYDFVTVVIRDLLKGIGISSGYLANNVTNAIEAPACKTPFEETIYKSLIKNGDASTWYEQTTGGEFKIPLHTSLNLNLYAPKTWQNGISLNYFMPQE